MRIHPSEAETFQTQKGINLRNQQREIKRSMERSNSDLHHSKYTMFTAAAAFTGGVLLLTFTPSLPGVILGAISIPVSSIVVYFSRDVHEGHKSDLRSHKSALEQVRKSIEKEENREQIIGAILTSLSTRDCFRGPANSKAITSAISVLEDEKTFRKITNFYMAHDWNKKAKTSPSTSAALESKDIRHEIFSFIFGKSDLEERQKSALFDAVDTFFTKQVSAAARKGRERSSLQSQEELVPRDIEIGLPSPQPSRTTRYSRIAPESPNAGRDL
ncbi:MAG: hypothetical protein KA100_05980 [Rickettsiales bacterium]|nr:hypothetical protein [Rickettsiales bacterium]